MDFFSTNIEYLRHSSKLTQAEIQDRTGIERTTWSNYERGKSFPNLKLFHEIAVFFGVSEADLLNKDLRTAASPVENQNSVHEPQTGYDSQPELIKTLKQANAALLSANADKDKIIALLEQRLKDLEYQLHISKPDTGKQSAKSKQD